MRQSLKERGVYMPKYGSESKAKLATCHPDLQKIYNEAIKYCDITILEGTR